jgi:hypothetical protein
LIVQDGSLLKTDALELDLDLAKRVIRQLYGVVEGVGGVLTILFHPHVLLDSRYAEVYRFAIEYGLEREAWVTSLAEVADWWHAREAQLTGVPEQSEQPPLQARIDGAPPS